MDEGRHFPKYEDEPEAKGAGAPFEPPATTARAKTKASAKKPAAKNAKKGSTK